MSEKKKIGCAICGGHFETPDDYITHCLVERHGMPPDMMASLGANPAEYQEFVRMLEQLQHVQTPADLDTLGATPVDPDDEDAGHVSEIVRLSRENHALKQRDVADMEADIAHVAILVEQLATNDLRSYRRALEADRREDGPMAYIDRRLTAIDAELERRKDWTE